MTVHGILSKPGISDGAIPRLEQALYVDDSNLRSHDEKTWVAEVGRANGKRGLNEDQRSGNTWALYRLRRRQVRPESSIASGREHGE